MENEKIRVGILPNNAKVILGSYRKYDGIYGRFTTEGFVYFIEHESGVEIDEIAWKKIYEFEGSEDDCEKFFNELNYFEY